LLDLRQAIEVKNLNAFVAAFHEAQARLDVGVLE
jgi:hypothetical protein